MTQSSYSSIKQICGGVGLINISHYSDRSKLTQVHCRRRAWLNTSGNHIGMTSSYLELKPIQHLSCWCTINYRKTNILSSSGTTSTTFLSFFLFLHIFTVLFSSLLFSRSSQSDSLKAIPDDLGPEQEGGDDEEEGGESRKKDLGSTIIMLMIHI